MGYAAFWAGPPAAQTESKLAKWTLGAQGDMQEYVCMGENYKNGDLRELLGAESRSGPSLPGSENWADSHSVEEPCGLAINQFDSSA